MNDHCESILYCHCYLKQSYRLKMTWWYKSFFVWGEMIPQAIDKKKPRHHCGPAKWSARASAPTVFRSPLPARSEVPVQKQHPNMDINVHKKISFIIYIKLFNVCFNFPCILQTWRHKACKKPMTARRKKPWQESPGYHGPWPQANAKMMRWDHLWLPFFLHFNLVVIQFMSLQWKPQVGLAEIMVTRHVH